MVDRDPSDINARIAERIRGLRATRGLTLEALAERSGVSRAMISRVERGESSPTAVLLDKIAAAGSLQELESVRVAALGKQGEITALLKSLGAMDPETRASEAPKIHARREQVTSAIATRKDALEAAELDRKLATEKIDLSLPSPEFPRGSIHPVSQVMEELAEIFADLGFAVAEGPEIESQWYNFTALNMPENHPARSMHDTFYVENGLVLRTHTSPIQIRYMEEHAPPIKIIAPGRVYRVDSDATHSPMFHQIEGLWIGDDVSFADLKAVFSEFLRRFFERDDITLRFRPSFFPFTEPSAEIDMRFGDGGWLEVAGAGQVHPNVLRAVDIDPERWQGFAFGMGPDRLSMLRYGVDDLRLFYENDLRFLRQFA